MIPIVPNRLASVPDDPDSGLVREAQEGNLAAFENLVRLHEGALFRYLLRMSGNRSVAEELAQAAFVRAWEKLGTFRREARFKTWLFRIAHRLCLNHLTRTRPTEELPADLAAGSATEPSEALRRRRISEAVQSALNRLPAEQRACLVLAVYEDASYAEIAQSIGKSVRAVDSLLVRARRNLRRLLETTQGK